MKSPMSMQDITFMRRDQTFKVSIFFKKVMLRSSLKTKKGKEIIKSPTTLFN